jgi:hypothetical protein
MTAMMARHGSHVQLKQSDMLLAWILAKWAKGGFRVLQLKKHIT